MSSINPKGKITALAATIVALLFVAVSQSAAPAATPRPLGVYRPSSNIFYSMSADGGAFSATRWGLSTDVLVPADYDGDGVDDAAVWRPENGVWYVLRSSNGRPEYVKWGMTTVHPTGDLPDVPVPADYDGDGRVDIAVWRPDTGVWYVLLSSNNYNQRKASYFKWGALGDIPVPADYDGDGKTDFAVFRPLGNLWYIFQSASSTWKILSFGIAGIDMLVPADYTGDGRADMAVYRSGVWYVVNSETGETETLNFGYANATPAPGDFDGDGRTDFAVFRAGTWFIYGTEEGDFRSINFGSEGDVPLSSLFAKPSMIAVP